jgi:hypothetical protein
MEPNWHPCVTSIMSSGNKKTVHPSFLATLMMYVAFSFFSSSTTEKKKKLMQQRSEIEATKVNVAKI